MSEGNSHNERDADFSVMICIICMEYCWGKIDSRFHPYDPIAYRVEVCPEPEMNLIIAVDIEENGGG